MKAVWRGRVIAQSEEALEVGGYWYFPPDSVTADLLNPSPKTENDRACPHGVQFYDLVEGSATSERAAWSYDAPRGSMKRIDRWIGFWEDVAIE